MKTRNALVLAAFVASAASVSAELVTDHGAPFYNTFSEGKAAAAKAGEPVLVKFYTQW
ncbi:MAG: hypothetical protein HY851_06425 [candidate division Zixibacteria bacterium]|nr:hypothetical protein [candidate division Zixibacteria bacterium]